MACTILVASNHDGAAWADDLERSLSSNRGPDGAATENRAAGVRGPRMLSPRTQPGHGRARTLSLDSVAYDFFSVLLFLWFPREPCPREVGATGDGGEMTAALFTRNDPGVHCLTCPGAPVSLAPFNNNHFA